MAKRSNPSPTARSKPAVTSRDHKNAWRYQRTIEDYVRWTDWVGESLERFQAELDAMPVPGILTEAGETAATTLIAELKGFRKTVSLTRALANRVSRSGRKNAGS